MRRTGGLRVVGSIEGVIGLHEGSNLQSARGTRCIVCLLSVWLEGGAKAEGGRRWEVVCCQLELPENASSGAASQTAKQGHSHIPIGLRWT